MFGKDDGGEDPPAPRPTLPNPTGPSSVWALAFSLFSGPPELLGLPSLLLPVLLAPPRLSPCIHIAGTTLGSKSLPLLYSSLSCLQGLAPVLLHSFISHPFIQILSAVCCRGGCSMQSEQTLRAQKRDCVVMELVVPGTQSPPVLEDSPHSPCLHCRRDLNAAEKLPAP